MEIPITGRYERSNMRFPNTTEEENIRKLITELTIDGREHLGEELDRDNPDTFLDIYIESKRYQILIDSETFEDFDVVSLLYYTIGTMQGDDLPPMLLSPVLRINKSHTEFIH